MDILHLKNSDLTVSRLAMGGCPMGQYGWGKVSRTELIAAVHTALSLGINFFDSADTYGLGEAERTLGDALSGRRHDAIIATKFGVCVEDGHTFYDNSPDYIKKACEGSLRRLRTDYIDIYQVHYLDGITPFAEVVGALESLRSAGYIRYFGFSNINEENISTVLPFCDRFVSVQNEYSLACRKNEDILRRLSDVYNLTPMSWGSLGQGVLTGKYNEKSVFSSSDRRSRDTYVNFHGEKLRQNLKIVEKLRRLSEETNKPIMTLALRFILDKLPESVSIVGMKNPRQVHLNAEAADFSLTPDMLDFLAN